MGSQCLVGISHIFMADVSLQPFRGQADMVWLRCPTINHIIPGLPLLSQPLYQWTVVCFNLGNRRKLRKNTGEGEDTCPRLSQLAL